MTQANDLGAIANQLAALYRARVNANIQALVTQHYGASEPPVLYPNMIWFSSGDGYIKVRSPTNTAWANIGTIGPPMKWTNVDIPSAAWKTGDIKPSFASGETGWIVLNDGTIGNGSSGATTRANPLAEAHLPAHYHTIPAHNHALARTLPNYATNKSTSSGPYTIADVSSGVNWTENYPGGTTGYVGSGHGHPNVGPRFYCNFLCKL